MGTKAKISATLSAPDLAFLEDYMKKAGFSRSRALQEAIRALREESLEAAYLAADDEWYADTKTAADWALADDDGLSGKG